MTGIVLLLFCCAEIGARIWEKREVLAETDYDRVLELTPAPYTAYHARPQYQSAVVNTNALGWRAPEIDSNPTSGTFRIMMLGGSAVFGMQASSDSATIPAQLEQHLRQLLPDRKIEVINVGQPWYNSSQELAQYETIITSYHPHMVVVVDGYTDFYHGLVTERVAGYPPMWRPYRFDEALMTVINPRFTWQDISRLILKLASHSALVRRGRDMSFSFKKGEVSQMNSELVDVYVRNSLYLHALTKRAGVLFVHALQPIISDRKERHENEQNIISANQEEALDLVQSMMADARNRLMSHPDFSPTLNVDLREGVQGGGRIFADAENLTDFGNARVASVLTEAIISIIPK